MEHIYIREVEYIYSTEYDAFEEKGLEGVLGFIKVVFDFAYIKDCKITISTTELNKISDENIKKHILKCLNTLLERRFIDEI